MSFTPEKSTPIFDDYGVEGLNEIYNMENGFIVSIIPLSDDEGNFLPHAYEAALGYQKDGVYGAVVSDDNVPHIYEVPVVELQAFLQAVSEMPEPEGGFEEYDDEWNDPINGEPRGE